MNDKQAHAAVCKRCGEWVIIGYYDKKPIALNILSLNDTGLAACYLAGIKVWVMNEIREMWGDVLPRTAHGWSSHEWKAQHRCPIDQVLPPEDAEGPPEPPCLPLGTLAPDGCTMTAESRSRGQVSCAACELPPSDAPSSGELLVSELGATMLEMKVKGEVVYRAN